ncbi:helix-turn-helix domain-containing protein [Dermabacter jinjuensis]|uniref:helix-turn-helix domain-containing protein n=1 Tax=Dermabacter jinjuensis TaxID=1667168 RepID=UPI0038BBFB8D
MRARSSLSEHQREQLVGLFEQGMSYQAAANALGVSRYAVRKLLLRLPSFSGHPISADLVSVGEDVHCESTAQEVHAGVSA